MHQTTPLDRITDTLSDLRKLQQAGDLLHRVAQYLPARKYGLVTYAAQKTHPDTLSSLVESLECAITMYERLQSLYHEAPPYGYPVGYQATPEGVRLWGQVNDYFGFNDNE